MIQIYALKYEKVWLMKKGQGPKSMRIISNVKGGHLKEDDTLSLMDQPPRKKIK